MQDYKELTRRASPGGHPQPLAFWGDTLWVGCWDTSRLYELDTATWSVRSEAIAPGRPFGLAAHDGALRVVISHGEADDRYFYRFDPRRGFDLDSKTACPDLTGSHLTSDGTTLYLGQMSNQRILALDVNLAVMRAFALPTRCAGICSDAGTFFMIGADEEFDELQLGTLDVTLDEPSLVPIAQMSPFARGLARSGGIWWTSHRDESEIVSFATGEKNVAGAAR